MITVGGSNIPTPTTFQVGVMDISKSERNANGNLIIEIIATKRKLEMTWAYMTASDLSTLLTAISSSPFTVVYPDPVTGANRSASMYVGDRTLPMLFYNAGTPEYKDVKFNFIEV